MNTAHTAARPRTFLCWILVLGGAACSNAAGSAPQTDSGAAPDAAGSDDAGDDIDYAGEATDTATRGTSTTSLTNTKAVTELFVQEDPTINPTETAGQNADAIAAQLAEKLGGDGGGCAAAQISHTSGAITVAVSFGTACSVPSLGLTISGSASAEVSKLAGNITIAFTFANLDVNGLTINGTASESTSDGTTYASHVDLMESTHHVVFTGTAALDANDAGVTLNGSGTYQDGVAPQMTFQTTNVHHTFGACYADAGTLAFQKSVTTKRDAQVSETETITFSSTTPSTGQAEISIGGTMSVQTLPAYGGCPHP